MSPLINDSGQFRLSGYRGVDDVTAPRRQPDRGIRLRQRDRDLDADPPVHLDGGSPRRGRGGVRRAQTGFRWKHVSAEHPARKRRAGRQIYYGRDLPHRSPGLRHQRPRRQGLGGRSPLRRCPHRHRRHQPPLPPSRASCRCTAGQRASGSRPNPTCIRTGCVTAFTFPPRPLKRFGFTLRK